LPIHQALALPVIPQAVVLVDPPTTALLTAISGSTAASAAALVTLNTAVGLPGVSQGVVAGIINGALKAASAVCSNVSKFQEIAGTADNFSSFSLIGGSPTEALQITTKLSALIGLKTCDQAQLDALKIAIPDSLMTAQELTRRMAVLNSEIASLSTRIEALKARQSASFKDVLKAVAIKLLLTYSQQLTTKMINTLIYKYKINDYLQYADAVASTVYNADYVNKNYPNVSNQLILRSILQNGTVQGEVLPMIRQEAQENLGFSPDLVLTSDPSYYVKMAQVQSMQNDPYTLGMIYRDRASQVQAQGLTSAQQEISQGKGFIPVRNCSGAVSQQKQIDVQNIKLSYQADLDYQTLAKLQSAYTMMPTTQMKAQLDTATAAYQQSQTKLKALPQSVDKAFVTLCEGINNPGAFVGDSIQSYLQQHLQQSGTLNNNNLPFYGSFIQSVAMNFINNIFTGGKSNAQLLTEAGLAAGTVVANDAVNKWDENKAQNQVDQNITENKNTLTQASKNGATLKASSITGSTAQFQLLWDTTGYTTGDVGFITITGGSGLSATAAVQALGQTGSKTLAYPPTAYGSTYTLNMYAKGAVAGTSQPMDQVSISVVNPTFISSSGNVFGAYAGKPSEPIRGPGNSLRGE